VEALDRDGLACRVIQHEAVLAAARERRDVLRASQRL